MVDGYELVRLGLQDLLGTAGFVVVGMSGSAKEATGLIPALRPDLVVIDANLPDGSAVEVCRDVCSAEPSINCLVLTSYDDEHAMRGVVLAGAVGYVLKELDAGSMLGAMRRASRGQSLFNADVRTRIIQGLIEPQKTDPRVSSLTPQERRVLQLMGEGVTNRLIAEHLVVSEDTVRNHVSSLLIKLGFKRRSQGRNSLA